MQSTSDKRKVEEKSQEMDSEASATKLPKITDLMAPDELPPAAFATTLPQVTTVQTGQVTSTIPENSQIVVPVLPECVPLIAEVPDVVPESAAQPEKTDDKGNQVVEEVKISQVLPGYAPSYASDYVPSEVDKNSYNSFVNTLSFNVSRYPTLTEITESKNYSKADKKKEETQAPKPDESFKKKTFDYVPAEYLTGQDTESVKAKASQSMCALVKPEVLSSGRVLTTMTVPHFTEDENVKKKDESTDTEEDEKSSDEKGAGTDACAADQKSADNGTTTPAAAAEKGGEDDDLTAEKENLEKKGQSVTSTTTEAKS